MCAGHKIVLIDDAAISPVVSGKWWSAYWDFLPLDYVTKCAVRQRQHRRTLLHHWSSSPFFHRFLLVHTGPFVMRAAVVLLPNKSCITDLTFAGDFDEGTGTRGLTRRRCNGQPSVKNGVTASSTISVDILRHKGPRKGAFYTRSDALLPPTTVRL